MNDCLIDVLNERETVLHVFPIPLENPDGTVKAVDPEQEALKLAADLQLAPEGSLHVRPHVSRGGPLMPYGDALKIKQEMRERAEQRIRERAYFIWRQEGCPEHRAPEHWYQACEIESRRRLD